VTPTILIGAGGHARMIVDILKANVRRVDAVFHPIKLLWLDGKHQTDETDW
jgi:hypothetical protein